MPANPELTFGALSRRQQCEAATLIVCGIVSSGLAIAMFVGSTATQTREVRAAADVVLAGEAPAAANDSRVAAIVSPVAATAVDRATIAVSAHASIRSQPRRVTAPRARPADRPSHRPEPERSRFARLLFGDGRRHIVRPFPVIDSSSPETR